MLLSIKQSRDTGTRESVLGPVATAMGRAADLLELQLMGDRLSVEGDGELGHGPRESFGHGAGTELLHGFSYGVIAEQPYNETSS